MKFLERSITSRLGKSWSCGNSFSWRSAHISCEVDKASVLRLPSMMCAKYNTGSVIMKFEWTLLTDSPSGHASRSWVAPRSNRVGVHQFGLGGNSKKKAERK